VLSLLKEPYSNYLVLGEVICVSTWLLLFFSLFKKNKRVFLWSHGWYGRESFFKTILKKLFFTMADGVFLYGNYARDLMIKEGFAPKKLHVIYNSLSYDEQLKIRQKIKSEDIFQKYFSNTNKNLIFIGRLTKEKRLDLLFNALDTLKEKGFSYNLTIIGGGEEADELKSISVDCGLTETTRFYGACYSEEELSSLLYNADLCVSPGNVGLTAIHSMTYGTPVLTHNNFKYQGPEFESIEEGITGMYFEYNDYNSLSERIKDWFEMNLDRNNIRENCYHVIDTKYNPHIQLEILSKYLSL
jgi:glycosyltransferase involved in cell wall biosynthesis